MKLNQLIAILQSVKANATKGKTEVYQLAQKSSLFSWSMGLGIKWGESEAGAGAWRAHS